MASAPTPPERREPELPRLQRILVIEKSYREARALRSLLEGSGREIVVTLSAAEGLDRAREGFQLVVLALDGLDLLRRLKEERVAAPVLVVAGAGGAHAAVEAMRAGAFDFLEKPLDPELLRMRVERALEMERTTEEVEALRRRAARKRKADSIVGLSPAIEEVRRLIGVVAKTEVPVLISGETGTGKELAARTLHAQSERADKPFVVVDCTALPEHLLENELFGHEAGAFTGADRPAPGLVAEAAAGTLFVDEVGELPPALQAKVLRFLQTREFRRVGASQPTRVDARVVCATHRDLAAEVRAGRFRQDLYYRIHVFPIRIPALRERRADVPLLADHFLKLAARETGRPAEGFDAGAHALLSAHPWPGNVRELENVVRRLAVLAGGARIPAAACREALAAAAVPATGATPGLELHGQRRGFHEARAEVVEQFEKRYFAEVLEAAHGRVVEAAEIAGLDRKSLWLKLKKYGLGRYAEPARRPRPTKRGARYPRSK